MDYAMRFSKYKHLTSKFTIGISAIFVNIYGAWPLCVEEYSLVDAGYSLNTP